MENKEFYKGKRFEKLEIIGFTTRNGKQVVECKCDCGEIAYYPKNVLRRRKSCGCLEKKHIKEFGGTNKHLSYAGGTHIDVVKNQVLRKNNTSGHRGVCKLNGKWKAYMKFRGKYYNLGFFDDKNDAVKARLKAEEEIVKPFLELHRGA